MSAQFGVDYLRPFVEVDHGCRPGDSMADLVFSSALSDVRTSFPVTFCCLHLAEGAVALDHPLGLVCHPGPTCVDDDAIYLQHDDAATLSANLLATTKNVLVHGERHGLELDVKHGKSEAVVSLRGQGDRVLLQSLDVDGDALVMPLFEAGHFASVRSKGILASSPRLPEPHLKGLTTQLLLSRGFEDVSRARTRSKEQHPACCCLLDVRLFSAANGTTAALECARMRALRALIPTCRARLALTDAALRRKWKVQSPEQVGAVVSPAPCPGPLCTAFSGEAAIFCSVVPCCGPHVDDAKSLQGSGPALACRQHPRVIADPVCTTCSREGAPGVQLGHAYCLSCKSRCFQFPQSDRLRVRRRAVACHLRRQLCATHGSGLRRLEQSGKVESVVLVMVLGSVTGGRLGRWDVDGVFASALGRRT